MIRQLAILAVAAVCVTATTPTAPHFDLAKGQAIFEKLLSHFYEGKTYAVDNEQLVNYCEVGTDYEIYGEKWQVPMEKFCLRYRSGMLPRGHLFSAFYPYQLEEAVLLFNVFYSAPTFTDFVSFTYWAYKHVNEYQFYYSLGIMVTHSHNTINFKWMEPYRVFPEFFFNSEVMKQIYDFKMNPSAFGHSVGDEYTHVVVANYSNWYTGDISNYEDHLTYFMEDLDLNTWYYEFQMLFPFWMSSEQFPKMSLGGRGEIYYFTHKMLMNRYNMERFSHGLDKVNFLNWDKPISVGYTPSMYFPNGIHFPKRDERSETPVWKNKYVEEIEEFESRISSVVDSGFVWTKDGQVESILNEEGLNKLANLIQGNNDSLFHSYYGNYDALARHILTFGPEPFDHHQILPGALELFTTSLRDPAFYRLYAKIIDFFFRYKVNLGHYTPEQLAFDGVSFESVKIVGDLVTYFEQKDTVIDKFWHFRGGDLKQNYVIKARQNRLNHYPFAYDMVINSVKDVKASIRVFLGPKYNVHGKDIENHYYDYIELDYFVRDLTEGKNTIVRNSTDATWLSPAYTSHKVVGDDNKFEFFKQRYGFPSNLLLPIGTPEGMPFEFFFYVSEFIPDTKRHFEHHYAIHDDKPLGFPLDRPIHYNSKMPNMYAFDAKIFHKNKSDMKMTTY